MKMKKWTILPAALLAVSLAFYCADMEFNNPLDRDGNNFLLGETDEGGIYDALLVDENGVPGFYNGKYTPCDRTPPNMRMLGENPACIGLNNLADLNTYLGSSGWMNIIEQNEDPNSKFIFPPTAASDFVIRDMDGNLVPYRIGSSPSDQDFSLDSDPGTCVGTTITGGRRYNIHYTIRRRECSDGSQAEAVFIRPIFIVPNKDQFQGAPNVTLEGQNPAVVNVGTIFKEDSANIRVSEGNGVGLATVERVEFRVDDPNGPPILLPIPPGADSVDRIHKTVNDFLELNLPYLFDAPMTLYITYVAKSAINGSEASETRTVNVVSVDVTLPQATIVLARYNFTVTAQVPFGPNVPADVATTHVVGVRSFTAVDTAFAAGGVYRSKGAASACYPQSDPRTCVDGAGVPIANRVTAGTYSPPIRIPGQSNVTYTLPTDDAHWATSNTPRAVYTFEPFCAESDSPPVIAFQDHGGATSITIPAGVRWDHSGPGTWGVVAHDETNQAWRFAVVTSPGFPALNFDNPTAGMYQMLYVGLSGCGTWSVRERTVMVN